MIKCKKNATFWYWRAGMAKHLGNTLEHCLMQKLHNCDATPKGSTFLISINFVIGIRFVILALIVNNTTDFSVSVESTMWAKHRRMD